MLRRQRTTQANAMTRRDWNIGRLHIIKRGYKDPPQWGCLLWGGQNVGGMTFDVWMRQTLWTVHWIGKG